MRIGRKRHKDRTMKNTIERGSFNRGWRKRVIYGPQEFINRGEKVEGGR